MTVPALLLADPSPCLRSLVLRRLFGRSGDDPEVRELAAMREEDPLVSSLLRCQEDDGSWGSRARLIFRGTEKLRNTSLALTRLGYLGFGRDLAAVQRGAAYLFRRQRRDGGWPLKPTAETRARDKPAAGERVDGYSMIPLQTAVPLRALASCGYAEDERAERAYVWLLARRLPEGAWPTGIASGNFGGVAGYRRLPHSRWGCRSNTTAALLCLAHHPRRRTSPEARRAMDLLLGRETREESSLGFETARLVGAEPTRGFLTLHARFDLALMLALCRRVGAGPEDDRIAEVVRFVSRLRKPSGLWDYPSKPQAARWVSFDLLVSLTALQKEGDWLSAEPRTPFRPYPKRRKRY